jgi:hypothetical protein
MSENFGRFILEVDNIVYELEKRGRNWVDDNVKLTNMGMLRSAERFRARFKEEVVKDYEVKIDDTLNKAVDWFMKKYLKVWQDTSEYFADQAARRHRSRSRRSRTRSSNARRRRMASERSVRRWRPRVTTTFC